MTNKRSSLLLFTFFCIIFVPHTSQSRVRLTVHASGELFDNKESQRRVIIVPDAISYKDIRTAIQNAFRLNELDFIIKFRNQNDKTGFRGFLRDALDRKSSRQRADFFVNFNKNVMLHIEPRYQKLEATYEPQIIGTQIETTEAEMETAEQ